MDNYYFDLINLLKKRVRNPYYIILSDNTNRAKKTFSYLKNKIISQNNTFVDLTIMSLCNYGIMSNSSISWWGGYLMKNRKILFGPKYWLGWKRKIEFQSGGAPSASCSTAGGSQCSTPTRTCQRTPLHHRVPPCCLGRLTSPCARSARR